MNNFLKGFEKRGRQFRPWNCQRISVSIDPTTGYQKFGSIGKTIKKGIGWTLIGGTAGAVGLNKLTKDPDRAPTKVAEDQREKIRADIKRYENKKKTRKLYSLGSLGALGVAGLGGFKANNKLTYPALATAALTGYLGGKAHREEGAALGRIKQHYDLRDNSKVINLKAMLPQNEKSAALWDTAVIANQAAHMVPFLGHYIDVAGSFLASHSPGAMSTAAAAVTGTALGRVAIDVAAMPALAGAATKKLRSIAHIAAKQSQGVPITAKEIKTLAFADWAKGLSLRNKEWLPELAAKATDPSSNSFSRGFNKARLAVNSPKISQYFNSIQSKLLGTASTGKQMGEAAGTALTEVSKISPEYASLGIKAIESDAGKDALMSRIKTDAGVASKAWNDFSNNTTVGKLLKHFGGSGSATILQRYGKNINEMGADVKKIQHLEKSLSNAAKAMTLGTMVNQGSKLYGEHRKQHPLSKDELPKKLLANS